MEMNKLCFSSKSLNTCPVPLPLSWDPCSPCQAPVALRGPCLPSFCYLPANSLSFLLHGRKKRLKKTLCAHGKSLVAKASGNPLIAPLWMQIWKDKEDRQRGENSGCRILYCFLASQSEWVGSSPQKPTETANSLPSTVRDTHPIHAAEFIAEIQK